MPYKYIVYFSKRFTSGILSGLTVEGSCRFPDWKSAEYYRASMDNGQNHNGLPPSDNFIIESAWIEALPERTLSDILYQR